MRGSLIAWLVCIAGSCTLPAAAGQRWPYGQFAEAAAARGDFAAAVDALEAEFAKCERQRPGGDACLGLLLAVPDLALRSGDAGRARTYAERALVVARRTLPPVHADVDFAHSALGSSLSALGDIVQAEPHYRQALAIDQSLKPARPLDIATDYNNLAVNLDRQRRFADAEPFARQALALRKSAYPQGHREVAISLNNLAFNLQAQGRLADAEALFREALDMWRRQGSSAQGDVGTAYNNLAGNLALQGRDAEAERGYRLALQIVERTLPPEHPEVAQSMHNLATQLDGAGRYDEAEALYRRSAASVSLPLSHPSRITFNWALAAHLQFRRRAPLEVRRLYIRAGQGVLERQRAHAGYTSAAQSETQTFRPIFTGQVRAAWDLAVAQRGLSAARVQASIDVPSDALTSPPSTTSVSPTT